MSNIALEERAIRVTSPFFVRKSAAKLGLCILHELCTSSPSSSSAARRPSRALQASPKVREEASAKTLRASERAYMALMIITPFFAVFDNLWKVLDPRLGRHFTSRRCADSPLFGKMRRSSKTAAGRICARFWCEKPLIESAVKRRQRAKRDDFEIKSRSRTREPRTTSEREALFACLSSHFWRESANTYDDDDVRPIRDLTGHHVDVDIYMMMMMTHFHKHKTSARKKWLPFLSSVRETKAQEKGEQVWPTGSLIQNLNSREREREQSRVPRPHEGGEGPD